MVTEIAGWSLCLCCPRTAAAPGCDAAGFGTPSTSGCGYLPVENTTCQATVPGAEGMLLLLRRRLEHLLGRVQWLGLSAPAAKDNQETWAATTFCENASI